MPPVSSDLVASRIRKAIADAGLTHARLAAQVGLDPTALSEALNGSRNFKMMEIALISETLGISVDQLLSTETSQRMAISARIQPKENPAADAAMAIVLKLLDLDDLLSKLGYLAWTSVDKPEVDPAHRPHVQGARLAEQVRAELGIAEENLPPDLNDFSSFIEQNLAWMCASHRYHTVLTA